MSHNKENFVFGTANYRLIIGGFALTLIGFLLMIGGGSEELNDFNGDELFSTTRITLAPLLVIAGYAVVIYGIMKKKKVN
ncbi:DUF3098 domain-containing protein [Crocinitomicaceae bacterium]|jgi:hypothetical protein|nr:DUF3098 domain-containing protein [Crocinitomicaceae bacterium]